MEKNISQLVSVIVVTYNSEKYVLETLESIKEQTYHNIELIITDDSSSDNTIQLCDDWIKSNRNRFRRVKLLVSAENQGIGKNINRGCREAKGEWLKSIAGDDILLATCIVDNMSFITANPNANFIFSQIKTFTDESKACVKESKPTDSYVIKMNALNEKEQFAELAVNNYLPAPSFFCNTNQLRKIDFFDDSYPLMEDYPTWLKILLTGQRFFLFAKVTILYRIHDKSISGKQEFALNENSFRTYKMIYDDCLSENIHFFLKIHILIYIFINNVVLATGNSPKVFSILHYIILLSPYFYYQRIKLNFVYSRKSNIKGI